jgi:gas vesicle protein
MIEGQTHDTHPTRSMLAGPLIGEFAGAAAMLLLAPQSGRQTRAQIRGKSIQLRDQTTSGWKDALEQARVETDGLTAGVREKAGELKHQGKNELVRQMDRASAALDPGKNVVRVA